ncbi:MAG: hypothetical protein NC131_18660 [Roseburia sp.]|nr:hypothetical protein [Roseburia sp.]
MNTENETKAAKREYRKRNIFNYILSAIITLGFIAVAVTVFPSALGRIIEGGRDFGLSVGYWFCELIGVSHNITPTVNNLPAPLFPSVPAPSTPLPDTWNGFTDKWGAYWRLWATMDNFTAYLSWLGNALFTVCKVAIIIIPLIMVVYFLFKRILNKQNNDYDKDSKPLKAWKRLTQFAYAPVKKRVTGFISFLREHKPLWVVWLCIWAYCLNLFTIVLEFFAFYFYFIVSFDVVNIYRQVYKLFLDMGAAFGFIPVWAWVIIGLIIVDRLRKKIAYARLNHFEMRNRGFINARPIVYMVCGTMGKKKTTAITDMALSQEVMFRDKAFEKLLENDLKFPCFAWIALENELKQAMYFHEVYNLATVRKFVDKKKKRFEKCPCPEKLFNYDYDKYGYTYDDKLKVVDIWQVIENYAQTQTHPRGYRHTF